MSEQEWATCHANAADQTVHLAGNHWCRPEHGARCVGASFAARSREEAAAATEILHHMTDHAAPLIAKLTAELAASYVVRLCQRERVTSN